jgi:uncharacterized protein YecE (DUF72 family)
MASNASADRFLPAQLDRRYKNAAREFDLDPTLPFLSRCVGQAHRHKAQFKFTAKLYRVFTHESAGGTQQDETDYRKGLDPIFQAGRLGAVLIQFPWSFKNTPSERERLGRLLRQFSQYPRVVELRHSSWSTPGVLDWFEEAGVGFCNIDQPLFRHSIKPSSLTTSRIGYIRLHGRNYQTCLPKTGSRRIDTITFADRKS